MKTIKIPLHPPLMKGGYGFINGHPAFIAILILAAIAGTASGQTAWVKYVNNPVLTKDTTLAGIWEWAGIGQPSCIVERDTIKLYYAAAGVAYVGDSVVRGRISCAYSTDQGITWIKRNPPTPVLNVGPAGAWDCRWLDTPAIVRGPDGYKLFYYADSQSVAFSGIGAASSPDGISWTKEPSNPVLERGGPWEFDWFWVESPAALYDSAAGAYEMWYTGVSYGPGLPNDNWISIGRATSTNGVDWTKDSLHNPVLDTSSIGNWDDGWVSVPAVRKTGGQYQMWYVGVSREDYAADSTLDTARVGYATSPDGISWVRYPGNPVLSRFDPPVDSGGPWAPDVVFDGARYQMLYEAIGGIFLATADQNDIRSGGHAGAGRAAVFPNPFRDRLIVELDGRTAADAGVKIEVYDVSGRLAGTLKVTSGFRAVWDGKDGSGRSLPNGIYLVRVSDGTGTLTRPCVKIE